MIRHRLRAPGSQTRATLRILARLRADALLRLDVVLARETNQTVIARAWAAIRRHGVINGGEAA